MKVVWDCAWSLLGDGAMVGNGKEWQRFGKAYEGAAPPSLELLSSDLSSLETLIQ
jgi:hypothetical protein